MSFSIYWTKRYVEQKRQSNFTVCLPLSVCWLWQYAWLLGWYKPIWYFHLPLGSISGTRKLYTELWDVVNCIWKYTIKILRLWVGCGASNQSGFCQAEGAIYESFLQQQCLLPLRCPQKKGRGGSDSPLPGYYQEPFLLSTMNGKNLLLFIYLTAGSLPGMYVRNLPLETLGKLMFWFWDAIS